MNTAISREFAKLHCTLLCPAEIKASPVKLFGKGSKRKQEAVLEEEEEEEEDEDEEYDEDKDIETDEFEMEDMPGSEEEVYMTFRKLTAVIPHLTLIFLNVVSL